jgi:hypothetical protein
MQHNLGYCFYAYKLCINFDKIFVWLHFGRLFLKLTWSPWILVA